MCQSELYFCRELERQTIGFKTFSVAWGGVGALPGKKEPRRGGRRPPNPQKAANIMYVLVTVPPIEILARQRRGGFGEGRTPPPRDSVSKQDSGLGGTTRLQCLNYQPVKLFLETFGDAVSFWVCAKEPRGSF